MRTEQWEYNHIFLFNCKNKGRRANFHSPLVSVLVDEELRNSFANWKGMDLIIVPSIESSVLYVGSIKVSFHR